MKHRKALLIIDMQKQTFMEGRCFDTEGVIQRINMLAEIFRKSDFPVIVVQHDGTAQHEYIPNTTPWELVDELKIKPTDIFISKQANDAFYHTSLQDILTDLHINDLVITGAATEFCLDSTVQSALVKDYTVQVVRDGHTTADKSHLPAEKIIQHYNWVWSNLVPTTIKVVSFEQLKDTNLSGSYA